MMCDTSLTNESKGTRAAPREASHAPSIPGEIALTWGNVESAKVID